MESLFTVASVLNGVETTVVLPSLFMYLMQLGGFRSDADELATAYALVLSMAVMGQVVGTTVANAVANYDGCRWMKATLLCGIVITMVGRVLYATAYLFSNPIVIVGASRIISGLGGSSWSVTSIWQARIVSDSRRTHAVTMCTVGYLFGVLFGPLVNRALDDVNVTIGAYHVDRYNAIGLLQVLFEAVNLVMVLTQFGFDRVSKHVSKETTYKPYTGLLCTLLTTFGTVTILASIDMWFSPMCTTIFNMQPTSISWVYMWATGGAFLGTALNAAVKKWVSPRYRALNVGFIPWSIGVVFISGFFGARARYNMSKAELHFLAALIGGVTVPLIIEAKSSFSHDVNRIGNAGVWSSVWTYLDLAGTGTASVVMRAGVSELDQGNLGSNRLLSPTLVWVYATLAIVILCAAVTHRAVFVPVLAVTMHPKDTDFTCEREQLKLEGARARLTGLVVYNDLVY